MLSIDVRNFTDERREAMAWKVHEYSDIDLPKLKAWNYELCRVHRNGWEEEYVVPETKEVVQRKVYDRPKPGCRKCGIHFRQHQRISIMWMYLKKRALLADTMGSGKTTSAGGVIAMLAETGELGPKPFGKGRVVVTPRSPALHQWHNELRRMMPGLDIVIAEGPLKKRRELYASNWDVLLIGPEMMRNDHKLLMKHDLAAYITDDVDQLRNPDTETSVACDKVGRHADRYYIMSGTPLQKKLPEMHAVLDAVGGDKVFGGMEAFTKRYTRMEYLYERDPRTGLIVSRKPVTTYVNMGEFKRKIAPMVLRRTAKDLQDVTLPTIIPNDVMLELYKAQRDKYEELKQGVIRILKEEGTQVKFLGALNRLHYGSAICGGLATLGEPDGPGTSVKMDWILDKVHPDGELGDEKVIVFAQYKTSIRALQDRLREAKIGFVTVWGEETNKKVRMAAQERFWEDPDCRVLLGTRAIEQSLNLQVSRHLINMDMILNQARMEQLAGRIRRDGSAYQHVYVHNLLANNTQEDKYLELLEREAALAGHVWDENSQLFQQLSPMAMLQLIAS